MTKKAYLILENGRIFEGKSLGAEGEIVGEVVFTTGMTGYLETLTDPSYHGQIVLQTFPLIGNYGVIPSDFESGAIGACGYIVKHRCETPSNFRNEGDLDTLLKQRGIVGISDIDTRAVTRIIRTNGVMNGAITTNDPKTVDVDAIKKYSVTSAVDAVTATEYTLCKADEKKYSVALLDFGYKHNIVRELQKRGCDIHLLPAKSKLSDIKKLNVDGIMLSNGPGDPAENTEIIENIKEIIGEGIPTFGICLGHQLLALAMGFSTKKLTFGHRGANQPVKDLTTERVYISSQNHGYAVCNESIDEAVAKLWFVNVNDNTCEGIIYNNRPIKTVQFHPEASAGPLDTGFLFDSFIDSMGGYNAIK